MAEGRRTVSRACPARARRPLQARKSRSRSNEKFHGSDYRGVAMVLGNLAVAVGMQGRYAESGRLLDRSVLIYGKTLGAEHPELAEVFYQYGPVRLKAGDPDGALGFLRRALPGGAGEPFMASIRTDYASLSGNPELEEIVAKVEAGQKAKR